MLVQRLVEYARQNSTTKPFHRQREFSWELCLSSSGVAARLDERRDPDEARQGRGQRHLVPSVTRTAGVAPQLGADDVQYVLGWGDDTTKPERVADCHRQFVDLIGRWAESVAGRCPQAEIVREFYARGGVAELPRPADIGAKQGVLISVDGVRITTLEALTRFWEDEVARRKTGGTSGLCLVCGRFGVLADTVPGNLSKNLVPGASNNPALISVNERVFGYRLATGLQHTPICLTCGDAMNTALTDLLSGPHTLGMAKQDSVMTWWVLGDAPKDFFDIMPVHPDPGAVNRTLERLRNGQPLLAVDDIQSNIEEGRFCSVTLGGNSSRVIIRDWIDLPLSDAMAHLAHWYDDHEIATPWDMKPATYPLWQLERATGRWDKDRNAYRDFKEKANGRPEHIHRDLLRAVLRGVPLPLSVMRHVVQRIAHDGRVDEPRAALLRLAAQRHPRKETGMSPGLDEQRDDPAYVAGRAFAIYEAIQLASVNSRNPRGSTKSDNGSNGDGQEDTGRTGRKTLSATFTDRHFSGAVTNPRPALTAASKLAPSWLGVLERSAWGGTAQYLRGKLDSVMEKAGVIPGRLNPEQQAEFILGYHHQRARDAHERRERRAKRDNDDTA
ncbi:type I-C CRISPR-associated protein Cas8c/Csd1 [Nocardia carnea]|uniref:type I-C CRISPR-associated protein Cas8c/Csd1 n=1 Tax=Nocardia carnea TaxID=37328 RepID=UPI00245417BD|nr:type I-C CRISPR-associated protein Cas8c/Csd1 [Nocardia carnea]